MSGNRTRKKNKRQHALTRNAGSVAAVLIAAACLSLSYLWLKGRCEQLGEQIKHLEAERLDIRQRLQHEESRWARMNSLPGVQAALDAFNLDMHLPDRKRVVRVRPVRLDGPRRHTVELMQYARLSRTVNHE